MFGSDLFETLFVISAFLFQFILICHFALRRWRFQAAMRYGLIVYTLSIAAALISLILFAAGKPWAFWSSGFIYLIWAFFGYTVEYRQKITDWRQPIRWKIFIPYVTLYLATVMFYWWPLALINKPLWYGYAVLFSISTILNIQSHK